MRKRIIGSGLVSYLTLLTFVCLSQAADSSGVIGSKPNIILLLSDDQGYGDLGRHGHPFLKTPNMDRLHEESVRMTDFSVSPTCAPTRASLMTGMQEFNSGVTHTLLPRRNMNTKVTTLPQILAQAGYATAMFGKWHLGQQDGYRPEQRGFHTALTVPGDNQRSHYDPDLLLNNHTVHTQGYRTDIFYDRAMDWISENRKGPFFCYIPTYNAHGPLIVPDEYATPYKKKVDDKTANYFGMLANLDWNIGRLLNHLEKLSLEGNTLIIFINDNGGTFGVDTFNAGMRGCKGTIWRGGTRAFCFWRWPDHLKPRNDGALSGHIDVLPTLADLAGAKLPKNVTGSLEGISLAQRLFNQETPWPDRMLFQHVSRWSDGFADSHQYVNASIRWRSWHLMRSATVPDCQGECRVYRKAINNEPMLYTENRLYHYAQTSADKWSLYNLQSDPSEDHDLATEHPEIVQRMSVAYDDWWDKVRPALINERSH